jgi:GNAT superfamily N-acetyltransferase
LIHVQPRFPIALTPQNHEGGCLAGGVAQNLKPRAGKLTSAKVQRFEAYIRKRHEGVFFELMVTRSRLVESAIELIWIIVKHRKQGVGTAIMRELCEFADRHAAEIRLTPASKGDYAATTSRARLIRFYKRFDFVLDKHKPGGIAGIPVLIRKPAI